MREEAGISLGEEDHPAGGAIAGLIGRSASMSLGIASPTALEDHPPTSPVPVSPSGHINNALAPGTAAGISAGPSALGDGEPVDWDLWQSVVYEGKQFLLFKLNIKILTRKWCRPRCCCQD